MSRRSSSAAVLLAAALAPLAAQDDWAAKVKNAVENPRYALRRAVSDDLARAGDEAVPAIRAYAAEHGRARVPLLLVDALARNATGGKATEALLLEWAGDAEFYWRSQALAGLAVRASAAARPLFEKALRDPSHLFRVAGARGLHALAKAAGEEWRAGREVLADPDPRARVLLALALWEGGEPAALPALVAAVADDRAFLDDAWGRRFALQAYQALRRRGLPEVGYDGARSLADNAPAFRKIAQWAEVEPPPLLADEGADDLGGFEVRSCRHGDLFVRWTKAELHFDLDRGRKAALPDAVHRELLAALDGAVRADKAERQVVGEVVCDYLQLTVREPTRLWKVAPGATQKPVFEWLERLAAALAEHGHEGMAADLRARLLQFAPR